MTVFGQSISTSSNAMMGFHCIHSQLPILRCGTFPFSLHFSVFRSLFLHHPPFVHSFHQDWHKHTYCVCLFAVTMLLPLANAAFNPLQQRQHLRHGIFISCRCNQALLLFIPLIWKNTWYIFPAGIYFSVLFFTSLAFGRLCILTFICPMRKYICFCFLFSHSFPIIPTISGYRIIIFSRSLLGVCGF